MTVSICQNQFPVSKRPFLFQVVCMFMCRETTKNSALFNCPAYVRKFLISVKLHHCTYFTCVKLLFLPSRQQVNVGQQNNINVLSYFEQYLYVKRVTKLCLLILQNIKHILFPKSLVFAHHVYNTILLYDIHTQHFLRDIYWAFHYVTSTRITRQKVRRNLAYGTGEQCYLKKNDSLVQNL